MTTEQAKLDQPPTLARRLFQPQFTVAAIILLIAAVSLNGAVAKMQLHFRKQAVDLTTYGRELIEIPMRLGEWHMVSKDTRLNEDIEHVLGTEQYVFRDYVHESVVTEEQIRSLREMDDGRRAYELDRIQQQHPHTVVRFAVTYYTGLVDTVAHIPDRCYVADGYQPKATLPVTWGEGDNQTRALFIAFEDQTSLGKMPRNVAYFFYVNDQQKADPLGVRTVLQNLFERHGYYMKVEMMVARADAEVAQEAMAAFWAAAQPEVLECLPDWQRVKDDEQNNN